jgi:hypothetical protein
VSRPWLAIKIMFMSHLSTIEIKTMFSELLQWAQSGSKLAYASIGIGVFVGLVLFRLFFRHFPGFIHSIAFSVSTAKNPDMAKQPSLGTSSRLKLLLNLIVPVGSGYAAYVFLPRLLPTIFP